MAATQSTVARERRAIGGSGRATATVAGRRSGLAALCELIAGRQALRKLALLGVPLAIAAALTCDQWWALLPLGACAWWWAPRSSGWEWLNATLMGVVGAGWASVGADALASWPDHRGLVAAIWIGAAMALAVISWALRRRAGRQ